jgi:hypothetical protein
MGVHRSRTGSYSSAVAAYLVVFNVALAAHAAQPTTCHLRGTGEQVTGPNVSITLQQPPNREARTAELIRIDWALDKAIDLGCRTPFYLVFDMPERVRFEGEGFFALPPKAAGPFGLNVAPDRMRVIVPLHLGDLVRTGSFKFAVYKNGPFEIEWRLAEIPKKIDCPRKRSDYQIGQWTILPSSVGRKVITIAQGPPEIVVQDRFSTDKPKRAFTCRGGEFDLYDYGNFYRVIERLTNNLVIERVGARPVSHRHAALFMRSACRTKAKMPIVRSSKLSIFIQVQRHSKRDDRWMKRQSPVEDTFMRCDGAQPMPLRRWA